MMVLSVRRLGWSLDTIVAAYQDFLKTWHLASEAMKYGVETDALLCFDKVYNFLSTQLP